MAELELTLRFTRGAGIEVSSARISIARFVEPAHRQLAIRPYPRELEETLTMPDGATVLIRPGAPGRRTRLYRRFRSTVAGGGSDALHARIQGTDSC